MRKHITLFIITLLFITTLVACQSKSYVDYIDKPIQYTPTIGTKRNNESIADLKVIYDDDTADQIQVLPVDLPDDFIIGVDMSSILDVLAKGGVFYNANGEEQDVFEILKDYGVNYVRIRLWHNPTNEQGLGFGGGNNDTNTGIEIAKRAARVGMRIALDFHYSDFWADPSKQSIPRAWTGFTDEQVVDAIYTYTKDTLKAFEKAGVRPHMVQIGNEINNGMVYPNGNIATRGYRRLAMFLNAGLKAVKEISPKIQTVIHLAEGASEQRLTYFFDKMVENNVEFDIIGLSYYSFWHGTLEKFQQTLAALEARYPQQIAVMEYSYGYTDYSNEFSANIYSSEMESEGGYKTSMQGQASYIRDVNAAVASIESGIGSFYWEPAWLAVNGAGWASGGAIEYLTAQGDDVSSIGKASWANQALFSFSGKVLPSLNVFNLMRTSTFDDEQIETLETELSVVINIRANETLPTHTIAYTSLDRRTMVPITWNLTELATIQGAGNYTIHGTVTHGTQTLNVVCQVEAYENYLINGSFEEGGKVTADVKDFSLVNGCSVTQTVTGAVKVESKNPRTTDNNGHNNLNIWASAAYDFSVYQTVTLQPGTYTLIVYGRSAMNGEVHRPNVQLYVSSGNTNLFEQAFIYGVSWSDWQKNEMTFTLTETLTVQIGLKGSGAATAWAHFDDFALKSI